MVFHKMAGGMEKVVKGMDWSWPNLGSSVAVYYLHVTFITLLLRTYFFLYQQELL